MELSVVSYNLRLDTPKDGEHGWSARREFVIGQLRRLAPDLCGIQEVLPHQLNDVAGALAGYAWVGLAREDGWRRGEFTPIFYRTERFELLQTQTFWLSETPDQPGSLSWDALLPRVVTWARLADRSSGRRFCHFNTHLEYDGQTARRQSAGILRRETARIAGVDPLILSGDFNTQEGSDTYLRLTVPRPGAPPPLADARYSSETPHEGPTASTNDWRRLAGHGSRIDYLFTCDAFRVRRHRLIDERMPSGLYPSDHLPLEVRLALE